MRDRADSDAHVRKRPTVGIEPTRTLACVAWCVAGAQANAAETSALCLCLISPLRTSEWRTRALHSLWCG